MDCHGINGSIGLFKGTMIIRGGGLPSSQTRDVPYAQISEVFVQRKSVVPFGVVIVITVILGLLAEYNGLWFIPELPQLEPFMAPISLGIAAFCAVPMILRVFFVNVLVRYGESSLNLRLVPAGSGRRLARRFRELSSG